jgi:glycosyltransferase involved in cell wall biosynthesis
VKQNGIEDYGMSEFNRSSRLLFVGRLSEEKGIKLLINVAKQSGFFLDIIGDGPLYQTIKDDIVGFNNVELHGSKNKHFVIKLLKQCSALIFPSNCFEGMPITILEAFTTGTPVIASNLGAMAYMIKDGENGLLVSINDTNEWVNKVNYWINLPQIEKNKFYLASRKSYEEHYTLEINRNNLLNIYYSVIQPKNEFKIN